MPKKSYNKLTFKDLQNFKIRKILPENVSDKIYPERLRWIGQGFSVDANHNIEHDFWTIQYNSFWNGYKNGQSYSEVPIRYVEELELLLELEEIKNKANPNVKI